jgi:MFS family permease
MGTFTQRTAQAWLVYSLTKSPFLLGLLGVFQFGPTFLFSIFAGALVDRFPKRKIIICSQLVFAVQALTITILAYSGHIKYWHILILALIYGCVQTVEMPSRQSFFVDLVGKEDLINSISLNSTIVNLARIIGPAVAGIIIVKTSIEFCFLLNTLSFIPVLYGLFMIKVNGISKTNTDSNLLNDIKHGIRYIKINKPLKNTFIINILKLICFAIEIHSPSKISLPDTFKYDIIFMWNYLFRILLIL